LRATKSGEGKNLKKKLIVIILHVQ